MKLRFTPRPWAVDTDGDGIGAGKYHSALITSINARPLVGDDPYDEVHPMAAEAFNEHHPKALFLPNERKGGIWWRNPHDVYLIAAAPDILAALEAVERAYASGQPWDKNPLRQVKAAIAKAHGED